MPLMPTNELVAEEPRYDARTVQKVAAVAARLQKQQRRRQEALTAREVEAVGVEAGLEPALIRQALAQVAGSTPAAARVHSRQAEFRALVAALAVPLVWGSLAYLCAFSPGLMRFFTLVTPAPLALLIGWLAGRKGAGVAAGCALILTLAPTLALLMARLKVPDGDGNVIVYTMFGPAVAGWLGRQGARLREYYFPLPPAERPISRQELDALFSALQQHLEDAKPANDF